MIGKRRKMIIIIITKNCHILHQVLSRIAKNIKVYFNPFTSIFIAKFGYIILLDDYHLRYITKLKKPPPSAPPYFKLWVKDGYNPK